MTDRGGLRFGDFTLDVSERLLLRNGQAVPLTPKAFDLLVALTGRSGRLVTKEELLREVWPDAFVEEGNIAYHVFALRRALGDTADGEHYVQTVPKSGYRFVAPVTRVGDASSDIVAGVPTTVTIEPSPSPAPAVDNRVDAPVPVSRFVGRTAVGLLAAGLVGAAVAGFLLPERQPPVSREPRRVEVSTKVRLTESYSIVISPDSRHLAFAGSAADGVVRLWVHSFETGEDRPLPGTEVALGAMVPPMFWSPDSRFIAFDAMGQLKKVDVTGGAPQTVCTLPALAIGGSWNQDGVIVVGSPASGLVRCPASGGSSSIVTRLDPSHQQAAHTFPWFLPDGRRFLYLSVSRDAPEQSGIYLGSLDTSPEETSTRILATGFAAAYVADGARDAGHLLFMRDGALFAQAFDPARVELTGGPIRIAGPVGAFLDNAFFSASRGGTLAFKGPDEPLWFTWLDRRGNVLNRVGDPGAYSGLALAHDATRAVVVKDVVRASVDHDLWLVDLGSGRSRKLTSAARLESWPTWSADDRRIFFAEGGAIGSIFEQSVNGDQEPRLLLQSQQHKVPTSTSSDGRFLLFTSETIGATREDVWVVPLTDDSRTPQPLIRRPQDQEEGQASPDGRVVAYVSNESGRDEVMLRAFAPGPTVDVERDTESVTVSRSGGTAPRWSADGKEIFFITREGAVASAAVSTDPVIRVAEPITLFRAPGIATHWGVAGSGAGVRFLVLAPDGPAASTSFSFVLDWQGIVDRPKSQD